MAKITLADIKNAADRKYGPFEVDLGDGVEVTLLNVLRLPKDKRAEFTAQQKLLDTAQGAAEQDLDEITAKLCDLLRVIAATPEGAERLIDAMGDDNGVLMELWEQYSEATQPGEASPSAT